MEIPFPESEITWFFVFFFHFIFGILFAPKRKKKSEIKKKKKSKFKFKIRALLNKFKQVENHLQNIWEFYSRTNKRFTAAKIHFQFNKQAKQNKRINPLTDRSRYNLFSHTVIFSVP